MPKPSLLALLRNNPKTTLLTVAALALIAVIASWGYREYQKHEFRNAVTALVTDSGQRLRDVLYEPTENAGGNLDAQAEAVARHLATLRAMDGALDRPFSDAADSYVLTVREVLRQRAASWNQRQAAYARLRELWEHMNERYTQDLSWTSEAIRRKEQLEKEYSHYRASADAYAKLLESYPAERLKLAPFMYISPLPDANAADAARAREAQAGRQLAAELNKIRRLPGN